MSGIRRRQRLSSERVELLKDQTISSWEVSVWDWVRGRERTDDERDDDHDDESDDDDNRDDDDHYF